MKRMSGPFSISPRTAFGSSSTKLLALATAALLQFATIALAQSSNAFLPGLKPPDVPLEWKHIIGIYKGELGSVVILERNNRLFWQLSKSEHWMYQDPDGTFWISFTEGPRRNLSVQRNS